MDLLKDRIKSDDNIQDLLKDGIDSDDNMHYEENNECIKMENYHISETTCENRSPHRTSKILGLKYCY